MVNAELAHNPYLLETTAKFNGSAPKINSQIEKYAKQPLSDWINKVPDIFSDEMNGYDFDLYFSGTKADFEALRATFAAAGVIDDVRLIHKETLEPVDTKLQEINNLLEWLKNNPNRWFDYSAFVAEHSEGGAKALNDFLVPYYPSARKTPGSTDVGDVSWLTPTAQFTAVTWPSGSPGHSWQNVAIGKTSIAHKGMLYAAKALAGAAADLMTGPALRQQAREAFEKATPGGYDCPIGKEVVPAS